MQGNTLYSKNLYGERNLRVKGVVVAEVMVGVSQKSCLLRIRPWSGSPSAALVPPLLVPARQSCVKVMVAEGQWATRVEAVPRGPVSGL